MTRYFRLFIRLAPLAFIPLLSGCVWVAAPALSPACRPRARTRARRTTPWTPLRRGGKGTPRKRVLRAYRQDRWANGRKKGRHGAERWSSEPTALSRLQAREPVRGRISLFSRELVSL